MNSIPSMTGSIYSTGKTNQIAFGADLAGSAPAQISNSNGSSFMEVISGAVDKVSELQGESSRLSRDFQLEKGDVGLEETMIAMQKASLSFQAVVQVRNKVVQAYNDIMNMPV
jgi:flagellar hook-basal body complex protein FliE